MSHKLSEFLLRGKSPVGFRANFVGLPQIFFRMDLCDPVRRSKRQSKDALALPGALLTWVGRRHPCRAEKREPQKAQKAQKNFSVFSAISVVLKFLLPPWHAVPPELIFREFRGQNLLGLVFPELNQGLIYSRILQGQNRRRGQSRVGGPGFADAHGGHWNATRHLDHGE